MILNILIFTALLVPVLAFALAIQCLYKAPRSKMAFLWFLKSFFVGIIGLGIFLGFIAKNSDQALTYNFVLFTGASIMPAVYFHFVSTYLLKEKNKFLMYFGYILAVIFLVMTFFSPLIIKSASLKATGTYWADPGLFFLPFLIYFWFYIIYSIAQLIAGYKHSEGMSKVKLFYLIIAAVIGFGGGGTAFLPQIFSVFPYGYFITFLYPIILSYGIFIKKY